MPTQEELLNKINEDLIEVVDLSEVDSFLTELKSFKDSEFQAQAADKVEVLLVCYLEEIANEPTLRELAGMVQMLGEENFLNLTKVFGLASNPQENAEALDLFQKLSSLSAYSTGIKGENSAPVINQFAENVAQLSQEDYNDVVAFFAKAVMPISTGSHSDGTAGQRPNPFN